MEATVTLSDSLVLASPFLALAVMPVLLLLVWQALARKTYGSYELNGLEYLRQHGCLSGRWRKLVRATAWTLLVLMLGVMWTAPVLTSESPLFGSGDQTLHKNFIVAFDMSPSMNLPVTHKGFGGEDLRAGQGGTTRYETAREALFDFLQRFEGDRFGLILFSTEPFLARWPTTETGNRFLEVLGDNIRRGSGTQLEAFSSLTNIDKALQLARDILDGEEGAIIMISDAEDDVENLGSAVRMLRESNIRLYTIGVGIPEEIIEHLSQQFSADPGFRIFQVDSEAEMREAYRVVGEVEESPLFNMEETTYKTGLRWLLAIFTLILTIAMVWLDQSLFHQSNSFYSIIRPRGKAHGV